MNRTPLILVAKVVALSALIGWLIDSLFQSSLGMYVPFGLPLVVAMALADIALGIWAFQIKDRLPHAIKKTDGTFELKRAKNPLPSLTAARTALIAITGVRFGAAMFGLSIGMIVFALPRIQIEIAFRHVAANVPIAVLALILTAISWWLEKRCSPPTPPDAEVA
jgi:hypothetical protein